MGYVDLITWLNHMFEWYVARVCVNIGHHNYIYYNEIGPDVHKLYLFTNLCLMMNDIIGRVVH